MKTPIVLYVLLHFLLKKVSYVYFKEKLLNFTQYFHEHIVNLKLTKVKQSIV